MKNNAKISSQAHLSIPFSIKAESRGDMAEVRIVGSIGFDANSEDFRKEVDALVAAGVKNVHLYINSPGGSCFDAAEIVNILSRFKGSVTGEGGALVASAATYIALHCKAFTMPENGMFMIHKPVMSAEGTEAEINAQLAMLNKIQEQYHNAYKAVALNAEEFETKWNSGDYWMTAQEAKAAGFITGVTSRVNIDKTSATMIAACGCPAAQTSDLRTQLAVILGLENDVTDSEILDCVQSLIQGGDSVQEAVHAGFIDSSQADNLRAVAKTNPAIFRNILDNARKTQKTTIDSALSAAVASGKIIWQDLPLYRSIAERIGFHDTQKLMDSLPGPSRPKDLINNGKIARSEWGLNDYRKFAPEKLHNNPELYASLMEREGKVPELTADSLDYYRRNNPEYFEAHPEEYKRLINLKKRQ